MTECCGKISMSIQPYDWPSELQQRLQQTQQAGDKGAAAVAAAAAATAQYYDELLQRVCTSGRPFLLMEVSQLRMGVQPAFADQRWTCAGKTSLH